MKKGISNKQFNTELRNYSSRIVPAIIRDVQADITIAIYRNIVRNNPVLTGLSRFNWFATIGTKSSETTTAVSPVSFGTAAAGEELDRLRPMLTALRLLPLGQKVWLTNNLPYIDLLENGSSKMAPHGIAELAILQALEGVKRGV